MASRAGHVEVAQLLLESNADPNTWDTLGNTPLFDALERGPPELVQLLLQHGADPNAQKSSGESLLHIASRRGYMRAIQQLLELGANVHVRDDLGQTPFQVASLCSWTKPGIELQREKYEIEQILLKSGAERL
jgi:uncharacterized protein